MLILHALIYFPAHKEIAIESSSKVENKTTRLEYNFPYIEQKVQTYNVEHNTKVLD